jgi:hypothetical protein
VDSETVRRVAVGALPGRFQPAATSRPARRPDRQAGDSPVIAPAFANIGTQAGLVGCGALLAVVGGVVGAAARPAGRALDLQPGETGA